MYKLLRSSTITGVKILHFTKTFYKKQFWSCFVACDTKGKDAIRQGLQQMDVIKRMIAKYPDDFGFVRTYSG